MLLRLTSGNQFGLDESELEPIIESYKDDKFVNIKGIQFFSGTQKNSLKKLGLPLRRFKTGTPSRVNRRSVDFTGLELQEGDVKCSPFSFEDISKI